MTEHEPGTPRIYWITEGFYPPIVGGQELFAANLVRALTERGAQVSVITRQTVPPAAPAESIGRVGIRRIPPAGILKGRGWSAVLPLLGYLLRLTFLLLTEARRYDIVILSGVKIAPIVAVPICRVFGKKCILRVESFFELHEAVSAQSLREMNAGWGRLFVNVSGRLRRAGMLAGNAVIAISSQISSELLRLGVPDERIRRIPNAVNLALFKPLSTAERSLLRVRLGLPAHRTLLIFSARLSRAKGLPMLIEAWPGLRARHPDLCLLVVGSGHMSFDDCEQQVKDFVREHGLQDDVLFLGESDRVHELLQAADMFVFPTEYEGFSLALVEALGCAMPVVATSVGAAPDLIGDGASGFLFPPQDPEAMVAALERALAMREQWPQIGSAARASVMPYEIGAVADQYLGLCTELMRPGREPVLATESKHPIDPRG